MSSSHVPNHSNGSDIRFNIEQGESTNDIGSAGVHKTDDDAPPPYSATDPPPPYPLVRRMSSTFIDRMDTSGLGNILPEGFRDHIPGMGGGSSRNVLKATFFCNICFTNLPVEEAFTLSTCGHRFCSECLRGWSKSQIENGIIYLKCFHPMADDGDRPCHGVIAEDDIRQLADQETIQKYERFKSNRENALSRQCPYCGHTQIGNEGSTRIDCENPNCGKSYCLKHSNAHPMDEDCEAYELRMKKEDRINEMAAQEMGDGCKPCPKCEFRIVKNGGCNHMKCVKCGCSFCWLCMEEIENVEIPSHYKEGNSACAGKQFEGMENPRPPICVIILMGFLLCIFCLPGTAMGLVGTILIYPCACCCFMLMEQECLNPFQLWANCSIGCMMIPIFFVGVGLICVWMWITAIYKVLRSTICPCLPVMPRRVERWWEAALED